MAAIDKSLYEKFIIESADGKRSADISQGVVAFTYYENIFSPIITARAIVVNTSGTVKGCLLYTSPSPRDERLSRMPSSA